MIGQTSYGDNNGDNCIQHVNRIIIGTDTRQSHHKDMESTAEAVRVRYYVDEKIKNSEEKATAYKARLKKTSVFSFEDIENHKAPAQQKLSAHLLEKYCHSPCLWQKV